MRYVWALILKGNNCSEKKFYIVILKCGLGLAH